MIRLWAHLAGEDASPAAVEARFDAGGDTYTVTEDYLGRIERQVLAACDRIREGTPRQGWDATVAACAALCYGEEGGLSPSPFPDLDRLPMRDTGLGDILGRLVPDHIAKSTIRVSEVADVLDTFPPVEAMQRAVIDTYRDVVELTRSAAGYVTRGWLDQYVEEITDVQVAVYMPVPSTRWVAGKDIMFSTWVDAACCSALPTHDIPTAAHIEHGVECGGCGRVVAPLSTRGTDNRLCNVADLLDRHIDNVGAYFEDQVTEAQVHLENRRDEGVAKIAAAVTELAAEVPPRVSDTSGRRRARRVALMATTRTMSQDPDLEASVRVKDVGVVVSVAATGADPRRIVYKRGSVNHTAARLRSEVAEFPVTIDGNELGTGRAVEYYDPAPF